jgi:hypothetical protein
VAKSLREGPDAIPAQATFDVAGYGAVDVLNAGVVGCSIVEEGVWVFGGGVLLAQPEPCRSTDRFAAAADQFDPDVILTLFGWPGVGGRRFDDGQFLGPCTERFGRAWTRDHQRLVDGLSDGRRVVVANVAPITGADAELQGGTRCLNELVTELDAVVFDYQGWLCPEYDCTVSSSLRPDGTHFRNAGQLQRDVTETLIGLVLPIAGY